MFEVKNFLLKDMKMLPLLSASLLSLNSHSGICKVSSYSFTWVLVQKTYLVWSIMPSGMVLLLTFSCTIVASFSCYSMDFVLLL